MRAITLGLLVLSGACDGSPTASNQFVIKVDEFAAPAEATYGEPFTVTFKGTIGGSTCSSLRRVERDYSANAVDFTFIGERCPSGNGYAMVVMLNQPEHVRISRLGSVSIRVRQPDGSTLTKGVVVR